MLSSLRTPSRPVVGLAGLLVCAFAAIAPTTQAATPRVHAITNARIVTAPGQVIERGNIVMRDGIIVAVGANAAVPADARIWKGDSLTVYAGMIDAFDVQAAPNPATRVGRGPGGPA